MAAALGFGCASRAAMSDDDFNPRWAGVTIGKEYWHFHRQLLERYKIILAPGDFTAIKRMLDTGRALKIEDRGPDQAIFSVRVPSVHERIYILMQGKRVITAWPPQRRLNELRRSLTGARQIDDRADPPGSD